MEKFPVTKNKGCMFIVYTIMGVVHMIDTMMKLS